MYKPNTIQSILVRPFHSTGSINQTPYNLFSLQHFILQNVQNKRHIIYSHYSTSFHRLYKPNISRNPSLFQHFIPQHVQIKHHIIHSHSITSFHSLYKSSTAHSTSLSIYSTDRTNQAHHTIHPHSITSTFADRIKSNTTQVTHIPFPFPFYFQSEHPYFVPRTAFSSPAVSFFFLLLFIHKQGQPYPSHKSNPDSLFPLSFLLPHCRGIKMGTIKSNSGLKSLNFILISKS